MKIKYTTKELISLYEGKASKTKKAKSNKPDFLDVDKDGNRTETMKKALKDKKNKKTVKESLTFAEAVKHILQK